MLAAIGQVLPVAVGMAINSLPVIAVVLVIATGTTPGADVGFLLGWVVGLGALGAVVLAFADLLLPDTPPRWADPLRIVLGVVLLFLAIRQWRARHRTDPSATPGWTASLDTITASRAFGLGFLLSSLNPKNALLIVSAVAGVVATTTVVHEQVVAVVVLVAVASAGVAAPVVAGRVLGDRARGGMDALKTWLVEQNAAVMTVVLLLLGTLLIGNGLGGAD